MGLFRSLFSFTRKEVQLVFRSEKVEIKNDFFKLLIIKKKTIDLPYNKLLVVVSKKVGKAHQRNKLKRQIKSVFYQNQLYKLFCDSSFFFVFIAFKDSVDLSFDDLQKLFLFSFQSLLSKSKIQNLIFR